MNTTAELQDRLKSAEAEIAEVRRLMQEQEEQTTKPPKWEDLEPIKGCFINASCDIHDLCGYPATRSNRNIFPTREQAEATIAEAQLLQLRDSKFYRNGWRPDWSDDTIKHSIYVYRGKLDCYTSLRVTEIWSFQDEQTRERFLNDQRELLEIWAKKTMS